MQLKNHPAETLHSQTKASLRRALSYEAVQTTNRGAGEFTPKGINKPTIKITIYLVFLPTVLVQRSLRSLMEAKFYNVSLEFRLNPRVLTHFSLSNSGGFLVCFFFSLHKV